MAHKQSEPISGVENTPDPAGMVATHRLTGGFRISVERNMAQISRVYGIAPDGHITTIAA